MKYTELLSKEHFVGAKTSAPTIDDKVITEIKDATRKAIQEIIPPPQPAVVDETALGKLINDAIEKHIPVLPETPPIDNDINDKINQLMQCMKELAEKDNTAPADFNSYSLNDDQITFILSLLLKYQDKYFRDIPLAKALKQNFMWNIPLEVYDAAVAAETYEYPDVLNPIFWFYIMCTEVPHDMIGMFVLKAINSLHDEDYDCIDSHADEYRKLYLSPEEDEVVEPSNGTTSIESFDPEIEVETIGEEE